MTLCEALNDLKKRVDSRRWGGGAVLRASAGAGGVPRFGGAGGSAEGAFGHAESAGAESDSRYFSTRRFVCWDCRGFARGSSRGGRLIRLSWSIRRWWFRRSVYWRGSGWFLARGRRSGSICAARNASARSVGLDLGSLRSVNVEMKTVDACWIESVESGWLFLNSGSLIAGWCAGGGVAGAELAG